MTIKIDTKKYIFHFWKKRKRLLLFITCSLLFWLTSTLSIYSFHLLNLIFMWLNEPWIQLFSFQSTWLWMWFNLNTRQISAQMNQRGDRVRESQWKLLTVFPSSVFVKTVGFVCFTGYITLTHRTLPLHISAQITIISKVSAGLRAVICHSPSFALKSPNLTPADSLCCLPN